MIRTAKGRAESQIGKEKRPDRAVDRNRPRQHREGPQEADAEDDARHHPGQPGECLDQTPAAPRRARRHIGGQRAEDHGRRRAADRQGIVLPTARQKLLVAKDRAVMVERQHVPADRIRRT